MEASCFALTFGHTVPALSRPCACETVRNIDIYISRFCYCLNMWTLLVKIVSDLICFARQIPAIALNYMMVCF